MPASRKPKPEPCKVLMHALDVLLKPIDPDPKPGDRISDEHGEIRCMAVAEGYVMCRRKWAIPFVVNIKEWDRLRAAVARVREE